MNERLSLQDLIDLLAKKREITKKDAETFLRELVAVVSENIENNELVKIKDFGTFKLVKVSPRKSVDVNTGEAIEIAAHYKLSFTPEKSLKEAVNRPFAHFESVILEEGVSFDDVEKSEEGEDVEAEIEIEADTDTAIDDINQIAKKEDEEPLAIFQAIEEMSFKPDETEAGNENIDDKSIKEESEDNTVVEQEVVVAQNVVVEPEKETEENKPEESSEEILMELLSTDLLSKKEDTSQDIDNNVEERKDKKRRRRFITLGFFIFIIIAGFAVCALFFQEIAEYLTDGTSNKDTKELVVTKEDVKKENVLLADSLARENKTDSISSASKLEEIVDVNKPLAVVTIKKGDTMRNIALEHYGHKSFWIYIYEENKDVIKNPNNVPLGTRLAIPTPAKYDIDANSKESIEKAKKAESKLITSMGL